VYRVLVVDDHPVVRRGIVNLLSEQPDLHVIGEAACETEAIETFQEVSPDLVVVDWSLKKNDSRGLITELRRRKPNLAVLVVSIHDETTHAELAVLAGARGYLMKQEAAHKIIEGSRTVLAGRPYVSCQALEHFSDDARLHLDSPPALSGPQSAPNKSWETFEKGSLSVVIPVFNSESTIPRLCAELVEALRFVDDLQILLVDDGSSDASARVCTEMHFRYPNVVEFIGLSRNFGEHNALLAGLRHARGRFCVLMDDDLQNPPSEIPRLLRQATLGFDVVYATYRKRRHPWFRRMASALHNGMATAILGKPRDLYLSSFKVLSRHVIDIIRTYRGPKPYLDALILRATANISTVESEHQARAGGRSGYSLTKLVELWTRMLFGFSTFPVRFCQIFSGILLGLWILAVCLPVEPSFDWFKDHAAPVLLWGAALLWGGVFGEYMARLHQLLHRTPAYVIRTILRRVVTARTHAQADAEKSSAA
jgi:undecaprenyl-phosphate 4-deoxy-4-formamido-L-arabinose transferase